MKNRFLLIGLLAILFSNLGFAQTQDAFLRGRVTDDTNEPLYGATIFLLQNGVRKGAKSTDFDGKFSIGPVSPGKYDLNVKFVGYPEQLIKGITLSEGILDMPGNIVMSIPDTGANSTPIVTIIQFREPSFTRDETTQGDVMGAKEIRAFASRGINNAVATSSGVTLTDKGMSGKGGRYNSNVYFVDGMKMTGAPNIPQTAIEQIATITGGVPAEYGDVTGTIINITTKGPSSKFFGGLEVVSSQFLDQFGYNLLEGSLSGPLITNRKDTNNIKSILGFFVY